MITRIGRSDQCKEAMQCHICEMGEGSQEAATYLVMGVPMCALHATRYPVQQRVRIEVTDGDDGEQINFPSRFYERSSATLGTPGLLHRAAHFIRRLQSCFTHNPGKR